MCTARSATPPNFPIYGVDLSQATIRAILTVTAPGKVLSSLERLDSSRSFNNRIYFLHLEPVVDSKQAFGSTHVYDQVLKVCGRFFGADKIQNEVSCLLLLEHYCPEIPVPRVLAYSEDGHEICVLRQQGSEMEDAPARSYSHPPIDNGSPRGWILLSRRPGRQLQSYDLTGPHGEDILKQLAHYVAVWRKGLPSVNQIGNIKIRHAHNGNLEVFSSLTKAFHGIGEGHVSGLLQGSHGDSTILDRAQYYTISMRDKLRKLETNGVFSIIRDELAPSIHQFMVDTLPKLSLFQNLPSNIVLTHYDLSPRNILVDHGEHESGPLKITGIVDWEFAGFFPFEEEFLNTELENDDDWPGRSYQTFLDFLEQNGVRTPLSMIQDVWEDSKMLFQLTANIAPWTLEQEGLDSNEVIRESQEAFDIVRRCIKKLTDSSLRGGQNLEA